MGSLVEETDSCGNTIPLLYYPAPFHLPPSSAPSFQPTPVVGLRSSVFPLLVNLNYRQMSLRALFRIFSPSGSEMPSGPGLSASCSANGGLETISKNTLWIRHDFHFRHALLISQSILYNQPTEIVGWFRRNWESASSS